jgi:uncharacterized membrane protein
MTLEQLLAEAASANQQYEAARASLLLNVAFTLPVVATFHSTAEQLKAATSAVIDRLQQHRLVARTRADELDERSECLAELDILSGE